MEAFKAKYIVSETEIENLTTPSHPIDNDFFNALKHVNKTHTDCRALLATEDQHMGLEIMQKLTQYLDKGYNRLFFLSSAISKWQSAQELRVSSVWLLAKMHNYERNYLSH